MTDAIVPMSGSTRYTSHGSTDTSNRSINNQRSPSSADGVPDSSAAVDDFGSYMLAQAQKELKSHEAKFKKLKEERKEEDEEDDPDDDE